MALVFIAIISIFLCYKYGDLKKWALYYPTILFYIIGTLTQHLVTEKRKLWKVTSIFGIDTLADYFICFTIFPFIIILFLSRYPKTLLRQIIYMLSFIFILTLIEYAGQRNNQILYYNGWSLLWTIFTYVGMFTLFVIHNKKPILAWLIFFTFVVTGMWYFNISLNRLI